MHKTKNANVSSQYKNICITYYQDWIRFNKKTGSREKKKE